MDQIKIGRFIAALRKESGLTQEQLGEKLGVTNKTISRWENGNYMPDVEMLSLLFYVVLYNRMMAYVENRAYRPTPDKESETINT